MPNFGPYPNAPYPNGYPILNVPQDLISTFGKKIVKGMYYLSHKNYIDDSHVIDVCPAYKSVMVEMFFRF